MSLIGKKIPKEGWGNRKKSIHGLKAEFVCLNVCVCVREREKEKRNNSFGITAIIFKASIPLFKKNFKSAVILTKTSFFLYFRDRPKMVKETKERRKYKRKTYYKHGSKKVAKAKVNLNCSP